MKINILGIAIVSIGLLSSCSAHKKVPYIQYAETIPAEVLATSVPAATPVLQAGDLLNIDVTATDPIAAAQFNKGYFIDAEGKVQMVGRTTTQLSGNLQASTEYYLVDKNGNINFPIIGEIHVAGLTKDQAQVEIANAIYPKYLKIKPVVDIRFMNFRVTVLGAVNNPGVQVSPNERLNIFEALALAGDCDIRADRENILLVRTSPDGSREVHRLNVHDKNMLLSPYYNLEPNDMLLVNYNRSGAQDAWQLSQGFTATMAVVGGLSSVTALVISIVNLSK